MTTDNNTITGTTSLTFALNNPGSQTSISSLTLTGTGLLTTIILWTTTPSVSSSNSYLVGNHNALGPGVVTSFTFYPDNSPSETITAGQTFNYVINFANGQSVSGSLIAQ